MAFCLKILVQWLRFRINRYLGSVRFELLHINEEHVMERLAVVHVDEHLKSKLRIWFFVRGKL